jgi:hypothetical protein
VAIELDGGVLVGGRGFGGVRRHFAFGTVAIGVLALVPFIMLLRDAYLRIGDGWTRRGLLALIVLFVTFYAAVGASGCILLAREHRTRRYAGWIMFTLQAVTILLLCKFGTVAGIGGR